MATRIFLGSKEFITHNVMVNGVAVNAGYEFADIPANVKTVTTWTAVTETLGGKAGHMIGPGTAFAANPKGDRKVLVRVTDTPEIPIKQVGTYSLITV